VMPTAAATSAKLIGMDAEKMAISSCLLPAREGLRDVRIRSHFPGKPRVNAAGLDPVPRGTWGCMLSNAADEAVPGPLEETA
jgi:hypothetical protein